MIAPVLHGEDRFGDPVRFLNGRFDCKVSGKDTGGLLCVFDTIRTERGGPGLHLHHDQDEWFYVAEGEFVFRIGETTHRLRAGDSVLGPRGVPHCFTNVTRTGRLVIAFTPAGTMEEFFRLGEKMRDPMSAEAIATAAAHGMQQLGPALPIVEA